MIGSRIVSCSVLVAAVLLGGAGLAIADEDDVVVRHGVNDQGYGVTLETPAGPRVDVSTPVSSGIWTPLVRWDAHPDGENNGMCRGQRWQRFDSQQEAQEAQRNARNSYQHMWNALLSWELPGTDPNLDCPIDPAEALPPAMVRDAVRASVQGQMPRPAPEIPPGRAITGLPAYLVTNHEVAGNTLTYGPVTHEVDLGVVTVSVTVEAEGYSEVDWGDGRVEQYRVVGLPYPHGEIRNTYRDRGPVTITVTDVWQVSFDVPGILTDTIEARMPPVTITDFPVEEIQAVRTTSR